MPGVHLDFLSAAEAPEARRVPRRPWEPPTAAARGVRAGGGDRDLLAQEEEEVGGGGGAGGREEVEEVEEQEEEEAREGAAGLRAMERLLRSAVAEVHGTCRCSGGAWTRGWRRRRPAWPPGPRRGGPPGGEPAAAHQQERLARQEQVWRELRFEHSQVGWSAQNIPGAKLLSLPQAGWSRTHNGSSVGRGRVCGQIRTQTLSLKDGGACGGAEPSGLTASKAPAAVPNGASEGRGRPAAGAGKLTAEQLAAIEDEEVLDKMLDESKDFEERKLIRAAMRELRKRKREALLGLSQEETDQRERERESRLQDLRQQREARGRPGGGAVEVVTKKAEKSADGSTVSQLTKTDRFAQSVRRPASLR
ncbi:hypothetical protein ANANG_G00187570 [Anguilla anguilla]|uniref:Smoothelin domain-containing protein n=1 Tax=Anguilla anguilla TaxID=7936 RepID=A0A9D3M1U2_ANGAN|nr:hypothetical protein ANANG_G00187570 [Anguilla anguilla]